MDGTREIEVVDTARGEKQAAWTLARAFQDDPALSWILPDPDLRLRILPRFFGIVIEQSQRHGAVYSSAKSEAAAVWYPPGDVEGGDHWRVRLWDNLRYAGLFKRALARGLKVAAAMHAHHPDPQPYRYLRYVGVAPEAQGNGWGGAIVRDGIERAAKAGCGVLLETATESNVAIYARLGFAITQEWSVTDGGPKFWTMVHPAP